MWPFTKAADASLQMNVVVTHWQSAAAASGRGRRLLNYELEPAGLLLTTPHWHVAAVKPVMLLPPAAVPGTISTRRMLVLLMRLSPSSSSSFLSGLPACSSSQWPPLEDRYTPFFQLWADGDAGRRLWGWLASASYCGLTLFLTKCRCMRRMRKKNRNRDECRGWSLREEGEEWRSISCA